MASWSFVGASYDFADAFAFGAATVALLALTTYSIVLRFQGSQDSASGRILG